MRQQRTYGSVRGRSAMVVPTGPSDNVMDSDPSHRYETVTGVASADRRTEIGVEPMGAVANAAGRRPVSRASDSSIGRWLEL